ncbi:putative transporter [Actinorhabdospora filicis]|uniref:Transporter n=1 Tax=Actinorhabdospora filicis TaxID=1785913 RepID=A0A9W6WBX0_9ACTN|nr:aspartate-alanine antiporter [Actinorhabdospora filicis]GLZ79145.1 putative transporter [Actinorhabdospora filicis]
MGWLKNVLVEHAELAIFLALAIGFFVGKLKYKSLTLGAVTGSLLAGVLIGALTHTQVPDLVKTVAFIGFLFALGYNVGPQFFAGLRGDGIKQVILAVISCVIGLIVSYVMAKLLHYGPGWGSGLLAGGLTQSAVIGVADQAIAQLPGITQEQITTYQSQIAVGYSVCYLFGTAAAAYFLSTVAPRMMGTKDLAAASHEMEKQLGTATEKDAGPAYYSVVRRAYKLTRPELIGRTIGDIEREALQQGHRVILHKLRRDGGIQQLDSGTVLREGDIVTVTTRRPDLVALDIDDTWGEEVDDQELLDYQIEQLPLVITNKKLVGATVGDAFAEHAPRVFVNKLVRGGIQIPWSDSTVMHRGDEITIQGGKEFVEAATKVIGYPNRSSDETDFSYIGLGIVVGGLIGIPTLAIAGASIGLTTSGGALIMGLVFGWLRAKSPTFGRFPPAANWLMSQGGLCMFVAIVGITSGPQFISGVKSEGLGLVGAGLIVTLTPMVICLYLGKYVFKFKTPILLGVVAGANTTTASIGAITDQAKSQVPVLGYTVPYAIGNTLLTIWGTIIVALLA